MAALSTIFGPVSQWAINFCPSKGFRSNWLKLTGSFKTGWYALTDCLMADVIILLSRSVFSSLRSERWQITGVIASIPISVAFSTNHSMRSIFLVGATAICKKWFLLLNAVTTEFI